MPSLRRAVNKKEAAIFQLIIQFLLMHNQTKYDTYLLFKIIKKAIGRPQTKCIT